MEQALIGVVVPVYKVEEYIAECIESILAQTYTNFRLILVDDGTPDGAGKICDEYAKKDPRIRVIHKQNSGPSDARNAGLEIANGEYIGYADSIEEVKASVKEEMGGVNSAMDENKFNEAVEKAVAKIREQDKKTLEENGKMLLNFEKASSSLY